MRIFEKMNFVYPGFLFALSAISIPIIIHLIQLRKYKRVYFSNTRFLQKIEQEQSKSNKLKNLLILLMRILSILFLVLAFAQPYIPSSNGLSAGSVNYVSVYIDNSFSMDRQGTNGLLLDEAKRKAKEIANAFSINDKFQLLGNELNGNQRRWLNKDAFVAALADMKISAISRTIDQVTSNQNSYFNELNTNAKHAFIVSDFQNSFYESSRSMQLDSSIQWNYVYLKNTNAANISIDSAWFNSPVHQPNANEQLLVKFSNHSSDAIEQLGYTLKLNNQIIAKASIRINENESYTDTLNFKNRSLGYQSLELELLDAGLNFDNRYFLSYSIQANKHVAIINDASVNYIEQVFNTEPYFITKSFSSNNIDYNFLTKADVIFINSVTEPSTGLLDEIKKALEASKTVVYFPSESQINSNRSIASALGLKDFSSIVNSKTQIERLNYNASLYKGVFYNAKQNRLDLPSLNTYYQYSSNAAKASVDLLFNNLNEPVLKYYKIGKGNVYQFAFELDAESGNFVKHSLIVPTFLRMATVHSQSEQLAYTIGEQNSLELKGLSMSDRDKKSLTKGTTSLIPEVRNYNNKTELFIADELKEAGVYSFALNGEKKAEIAFNYNRKESEMRFAELDELKNLESKGIKIWMSEQSSLSKLIKDSTSGKRYWKICVILALIFISLEILIIRAFK